MPVKAFVKYGFVFMMLVTNAQAQTRSGVGKTDSSFSIHKEYEKQRESHPGLKPVSISDTTKVSITKNIVYCTIQDRRLLLDVFSPVLIKKPAPAIMIIHGGGWRSGNKEQHHAMAQVLASLGYICFTPQYRLSTEALYPAAIHDLKSALRWIHANAIKYNVDTAQISVAGFSAGGQLAGLIGTTINKPEFEGKGCNLNYPAKVNAIIDMDGILAFIHPESGEGDDSKKISAATHWFGFSKTLNPELWKEASPLSHVSSMTPPVLFINSSVNRMHAGRNDFIKIMNAFSIYSEVKTFEGAPHSFPLFNPWFDSTVRIMDRFLNKLFKTDNEIALTIIVAKDGSGQFTTIQSAFDAIPANNSKSIMIYVKNGMYKEKLFLDSTKQFVNLVGEDKFKTILTLNDHTGKLTALGDTINTYTSQSFLMAADNFTARNISFENNAGFTAGQAVAIQVRGDKVKFLNCRFIGNQDVLFTSKPFTRQYFKNCYIEGSTDFIFGPSTAWFQNCHIHSKKNSHITAASTPRESPFGYVFNDCILTGDASLRNVSLGRPWRPHAHVAYMNTFIGLHIREEGWSTWNNNENHRYARFVEYGNYGPSSVTLKRLKWTLRLTEEEVKKYSLKNVLGNWDPQNENP